MRLLTLCLVLLALGGLTFGCTAANSPLDLPEPDLRQATGPIVCHTVESRNHVLVDETNPGAAVVFSGLDPTATYYLEVTGAAATSASGLQRDNFLSVAAWYVAGNTAGRIRVLDIGTNTRLHQPKGPISVTLVDATSSPTSDNTGSLTLNLRQGAATGSIVATRTLNPRVHCVGVGRAKEISSLDPNRGRYIIRGSQDGVPARFGFPLSIYESALVAYQNGLGLALARADLSGTTAQVIQLRSNERSVYAFFFEPSGGGVTDNFGSAQVCLEKINAVDERWGIVAKQNHFNVAAATVSQYITFAPGETSTLKWTGGTPKANASTEIKQVLVTLVKTESGGETRQEAIALAKGQVIEIPDGFRQVEAWATLLDEGTIADNSGTATLLVKDSAGRFEAFTLRANTHCQLVESPSINAVGMPQVSVQPMKRNIFSWTGGTASYLPPEGGSAVGYTHAFVFTTDALGRQLLPIALEPGISTSITPITRNGYVFFASNSGVAARQGGVTVRHKF